MIKNMRRREGGVRAWEHHCGHLSIVTFLILGMWSWADAVGFTVVERWLSCDTVLTEKSGPETPDRKFGHC